MTVITFIFLVINAFFVIVLNIFMTIKANCTSISMHFSVRVASAKSVFQ